MKWDADERGGRREGEEEALICVNLRYSAYFIPVFQRAGNWKWDADERGGRRER